MPQVGETRSDGKVWAGSDYGWQNPQTIWRTIKPPQDAVPGKTTKTLPGSLGTKVWTGKDYGWQTQATIDAKTKSSSSQQTPPPAPVLPPPDPATPAPATPAPATPAPRQQAPAPRQQAPAPRQQAPAPKPKTWAEANPRLAEVERLRAQQRSAGKSVFDKEFRTNVINPVMYNAGRRSVEASKKMYPETPKTQKEEKMDAFDLVLEYLTSEGHVDTLDEALYVMMEMDAECIQSICEGHPVAMPTAKRRERRDRSVPMPTVNSPDRVVPNQRSNWRPPVGATVNRYGSDGTVYTHVQR